MVGEKKAYRILYEAEIEIFGVDEDGYNYWKDNEPSDQEFMEAIEHDIRSALNREDSCLRQLNYWTSTQKVNRLSVQRIKQYPKKM